MFDYSNYRLPLTKFFIRVLMFHEVHLSEMNRFGLAKVCQFGLACHSWESDPDLYVFRALYKLNWSGDWYTFEVQKKNGCLDDRCVPVDMAWRPKRSSLPGPLPEDFEFDKGLYVAFIKEAGCVQKFPEHILVKGKWTGSSGDKDSGSKVILYGSEHLSVEVEGVNADGDDAEVRPQVSFKRGRNTSSKPDPNPKGPKKTKLDLKSIILEDDANQVTEFSATGGLLENLSAHLHGGKTSRDQPFALPTSLKSFEGPTTKVIADTEMLDPLALKNIDLSPSGKPTTGVASNV
ncbi:hypothetical protein HanPI659440_Chr14g0546211 [Helianthus annuus]|nr:hypothetical protein HanPI659440_Chr14g0546211 [Helianthus annuus]